MTVCAADLTLRDFSNYPLPCRSYPNQSADVRLFRASYVIELKHTQIGFTAIDARVRAKIFRNPAAIARAVARGVYDAPLVMNVFVPAIISPAVFALTCSAAASEAIAMFGKMFERKHLVTNATVFHVEDGSTPKCHHYCTRQTPSSNLLKQ
jgi:hypothetical protein